jgi:hypothetical protein
VGFPSLSENILKIGCLATVGFPSLSENILKAVAWQQWASPAQVKIFSGSVAWQQWASPAQVKIFSRRLPGNNGLPQPDEVFVGRSAWTGSNRCRPPTRGSFSLRTTAARTETLREVDPGATPAPATAEGEVAPSWKRRPT